MPRLIKRYGNRKLYDTQESKYVTLEHIAGFVKAGEDVRVIDNDSSEDLTAVTFAQIILEEERRATGFISVSLLRNMIQRGEAALEGVAQAGKRVQELVERGAAPGKALLDDWLASPQRRLEDLQKRIDERFKQSVDRLRSVPAVQRELERIETSIAHLEEILSKLRSDGSTKDPPGDEPGKG